MQLPKDYPFVVATGLAINLHAFIQAEYVAFSRKKIFPKEFLQKEFGEIHQTQLGEPIPEGGYPDTGNGLYSQKLSYKDWYRFNVLQRIHLNYMEFMPLVLSSLLAAGIYKPRQAAVTGCLYIVFRSLYSHFYKKKGGAMNKLRIVGAVGGMACILVNLGIFAVNAYKALSNVATAV